MQDEIIEVKNIRDVDSPVFLLDPKGNIIGEVETELQCLDICLQIKENQLSGYAFKFQDCTIPITKYGKVEKAPTGFFDKSLNYLRKLM